MATAEITAVAIPETIAGYNLTDSADFETLVAGAGNGVEFAWSADDVVVLQNDTGNTATFTIKALQPTIHDNYNMTIPDATIAVADGKTYLFRVEHIFKQSDGNVIIECDETADVLVLTP